MTDYGLFGKIVAVPGRGNTLAEHLLHAAATLGNVAGCRLYIVSRDPGDADALWVTEVWDSAEAHRASLDLDVIQELVGQARPLIAGMGERFEFYPDRWQGVASRAGVWLGGGPTWSGTTASRGSTQLRAGGDPRSAGTD